RAVQAGTERDGRGEEEAEARGRLAGQSKGQAGGDRRAGTADARQEGQRLAEADGERRGRSHVAERPAAAAEAIRQPEGRRAQDEEAGDREPSAIAATVERVLDEALEGEADDRGRDRRRHEQPRQPAVDVVTDAPLADAREPGTD